MVKGLVSPVLIHEEACRCGKAGEREALQPCHLVFQLSVCMVCSLHSGLQGNVVVNHDALPAPMTHSVPSL